MTNQFAKLPEGLESALRERLGAALDTELAKVMSDYADMIDRKAALYILGIEHGIVQKRKKSIELFSELSGDEQGVSFRALVQKVFVPLESRQHRTLRALLSDGGGGEKVIVLWDAHVDSALSSGLEQGDTLIVENAYYRNGELHAGQYTAVSIDKKNKIMPLSKITDGRCNVAVRLASPIGIRTYIRNNEQKQMCSAFVADDTGRVRMVGWDGAVARLSSAAVGDVLRIRGALFRNGELHVNDFSQVEVNPQGCIVLNRIEEVFDGMKCAFIGKIISAFENGGWLYVVSRTDNKDIKVLVGSGALRGLLGVLSPDIDINVAGLLKLKSLVGRECIFEGKMGGNGIFECASLIVE
ncbi:MAG: hypothetical protein N3G76_00460 [Candidatus Micrarchaeota archaeon]|nr:hypothetical protein [Candidatus Micrarchaeota archaeon]